MTREFKISEQEVRQELQGHADFSPGYIQNTFNAAIAAPRADGYAALDVGTDIRYGIERIGSGNDFAGVRVDSAKPPSYREFKQYFDSNPKLLDKVLTPYSQHMFSHFNEYVQSSRSRHDSVQMRADEGTIFPARMTEFLKARTYDVKYPQITYNKVMPISSEAGGGAMSITWDQYDYTGSAKVIGRDSNDLPMAEVRSTQFNQTILTIGMGYKYSYQEMRTALFANRSIDVGRADACRFSVEQYLDKISFLGNSTYNVPGLLSIPGAFVTTASTYNNGTTSGTTWAFKIANGQANLVLNDLNNAVAYQLSQVKMTQAPDTLILPIYQYALISSTPRSDNSDTTILNYFMQQNPCIKKVAWSQWMEGASSTGLDVFVIYDSSPEALEVAVPMPYLQHAPQIQGLNYVIPTETRYAGVTCFYPNSILYETGI